MNDTAAWIADTFGHQPRDPALFIQALTHGSRDGEPSYERLEFLGDRVLGLAVAEWLVEAYPDEPEGVLSRRIHRLVSGATCAEIAREIGAPAHVRLGKGAKATIRDGDNLLGDVVEALLGALFLEAGLDAARAWVRSRWATHLGGSGTERKHPKAELQEWALARNLGLPVYTPVWESGPDHQPEHRVSARIGTRAAEATAPTKRDAEAAAARALLTVIAAEAGTKRRKARAA